MLLLGPEKNLLTLLIKKMTVKKTAAKRIKMINKSITQLVCFSGYVVIIVPKKNKPSLGPVAGLGAGMVVLV